MKFYFGLGFTFIICVSNFSQTDACAEIDLYEKTVFDTFTKVASDFFTKLPQTIQLYIEMPVKCSKEGEEYHQQEESSFTPLANITFVGGKVVRNGQCTLVNNKTCAGSCGFRLSGVRVDIRLLDANAQFQFTLDFSGHLNASIYSEIEDTGPSAVFNDPWFRNVKVSEHILHLDKNLRPTKICANFLNNLFMNLVTNSDQLSQNLNKEVEKHYGHYALNKGCLRRVPEAVKAANCINNLSGNQYTKCIQKEMGSRVTWEHIFEGKCRRQLSLSPLEKCNHQYSVLKTSEGEKVWKRIWECAKPFLN